LEFPALKTSKVIDTATPAAWTTLADLEMQNLKCAQELQSWGWSSPTALSIESACA
jgi:hypothetical protein